MELQEFLGKKYVLVSQENFEDYLVFLGKGYIARKAALALRPHVWLTAEDDDEEKVKYTLHFASSLVSSTISFVPGEEVEELKPDGVKVKSLITIEGNKIIHVQTEDNGRTSRHEREFTTDKLIVTTTADGLNKVVTRRHELVK